MKRLIFLFISAIFLAVMIYFNMASFKTVVSESKTLFLLVGMVISFLLFFIAVYLQINKKQTDRIERLNERLTTWTKLSYHVNQVGDEVFNELPIGIIAFDDEYEIKWANQYANVIFKSKLVDKTLDEIHEKLHKTIVEQKEKSVIQINDEIYDMIYRPQYQFIYLFNETKREKLKQKYEEEIIALGILYLDNLDESLVSLDVSEQSVIKGEYLGVISDWVSKFDGYLKPYGDERLLMITNRKHLELMIQEKFEILDLIRNISQKNKVRVSLSIGIASWEVGLEELGSYAQNAIELAEKRGGDQVVVNIQNQKIAYFGAKLDASAKNSRVSARINAQTIRDLLDQAGQIFIMGHDQADCDAFGSMLAAYHLAKVSKKPTYLIIDEEKLDATVAKIYEKFKAELPAMAKLCITTDKALNMITAESTLMVVDTQSPKMVMSKQVLKEIQKIIVIDHHRIGEEIFNSVLSYIEPYASSTIELMMELMNFYPEEATKFSMLEASIMYSGLVVDTNNFAYRTGARTFEVAYKLKEFGADTAEVKSWLRKDLDTILTINKFISQMHLYLERFAFVVTNSVISDRILLAQITDEALQISGVEAAFTIAYMPDQKVGVSARSYQKVNVQLLMEEIGGGGHLNSAAAQIENKTVEEVFESLKAYLELEFGTEGENVKVILLEDVKGKGIKDQVIEVANGYAQFLINQKRAVLATDEQIEKLKKLKEEELIAQEKHIEVMKKIKSEIDHKRVTLSIQIGHDGKMFGSITTKQIVEEFEKEHGIQLDKKKIELSSEINSIGIYVATVYLHKDIKAQFEVQIIEK